jgi:hypothetical protein
VLEGRNLGNRLGKEVNKGANLPRIWSDALLFTRSNSGAVEENIVFDSSCLVRVMAFRSEHLHGDHTNSVYGNNR